MCGGIAGSLSPNRALHEQLYHQMVAQLCYTLHTTEQIASVLARAANGTLKVTSVSESVGKPIETTKTSAYTM
eukprot:scaffold81813_cov24-Prasinocladus_malaysianus.AAC.1